MQFSPKNRTSTCDYIMPNRPDPRAPPLADIVCRAARGGRPRYDKLINECCTKLVVNERSPAAFMRYYSPSESVWSVQPPDTGGGHTHTRLACRELVL